MYQHTEKRAISRRYLLHTVSASVLGIGILAGVGSPAVLAAPYTGGEHKKIAGKWDLIVTFLDGPQQGHSDSSQLILVPNGVLLNLTPGPGTGNWKQTGDDHFAYTFIEFIADATGTLSAYVQVKQHAVLSEDGQTYTADGTGTVHTLHGDIIVTTHTTTKAKRIS